MSNRRVTAILIVAATFSAVLTGCGSDSSGPKTTPAKQEPTSQSSGEAGVEITSPQKDAKVPQKQEVTGTAANIPDGQYLWLFTVTEKEDGPRYGPQSDVIEVRDDGGWTQTAYVGGTDAASVGVDYKIAVYLVPKVGSDAIKVYLEGAAKTGKYPGFKPPAGSIETTSVTVARK